MKRKSGKHVRREVEQTPLTPEQTTRQLQQLISRIHALWAKVHLMNGRLEDLATRFNRDHDRLLEIREAIRDHKMRTVVAEHVDEKNDMLRHHGLVE